MGNDSYWTNRPARRASRRRILGGGAAVASGLFVAACGGGTSSKPAASVAGSSTAAAGTTATTTVTSVAASPAGRPQAASGAARLKPTGTVTIAQSVDGNTLDPSFVTSAPEFNLILHSFDMLLWRDPKTLKPVPWLAQAFRRVDPLTWEFTLRPNVKFHDGTPLDAEAVSFSLERYATETIGGKPTVPRPRSAISYDRTEVVDATTVHVKTSAPSPVLPDMLTNTVVGGFTAADSG